MSIKKSEKIVRIVFVVILVLVLSQNACVQASWARLRIRRGMTANEALQVSGDWTWGHAHSERPAPEPSVELPFNHRLIFQGKDEQQKFASLEEVAQGLEQQIRPPLAHVAYLSGNGASLVRCLFRCSGQGTKRVGNLAGTVRRE